MLNFSSCSWLENKTRSSTNIDKRTFCLFESRLSVSLPCLVQWNPRYEIWNPFKSSHKFQTAMMMIFHINIKQAPNSTQGYFLKTVGSLRFFQPSSFNSFSLWDNLFDLCEKTTTSRYISPPGLLVQSRTVISPIRENWMKYSENLVLKQAVLGKDSKLVLIRSRHDHQQLYEEL